MTRDDYLLRIESLNRQLRKSNRKLVEANDEVDRIWARIEIEKLSFEIKTLLEKLEEKTLGRK